MTMNWSKGTIASVDYATKLAESQTIRTVLGYAGANDPTLTSLAKKDRANSDAAIPEFSYAASGGSITSNGVTVERTGSVASGTVTLKQSVPGDSSYAGWVSNTSVFNSDGLVTRTTVTLDEGTGTPSSAQTDYDYSAGSGRYDNGAAQWGKVTAVNYPDGAWESFAYDSSTGWLTRDTTPFKDSQITDTLAGQSVYYSYDTSASGGMTTDTKMLVAQPRMVLNKIAGVIVSSTLNRFTSAGSFATAHGAGSSTPTWAAGKLKSKTSISGYDSYSVTSSTGSIIHTGTATSSSTTTKFGENTTSQSSATVNPFGGLVSSSSAGIGQSPTNVLPTGSTPDRFGRTTGMSVNGGKLVSSLSDYGWIGPARSTDPTNIDTDYTYTPLGQVATVSSLGIVTTYTYNLLGNVLHASTHGNYQNQQSLIVDTYATFDALGRITSATDAMNRVTTYAYNTATHTTTLTYNDNSTMIEVFHLDGSPDNVSGTAVTPSAYDEGVEANGDTWVKSSTNGGQNWTKTYTDVLGRQYKTERSGPGGTIVSAITEYDGNGRPIKFTDYDGTITHTQYSPSTGDVARVWEDTAKNDVFDLGQDFLAVSSQTPLALDDTDYSGETTEDLSVSGNQSDFVGEKNAGLDSESVSNGRTTTHHTELNTPSAGNVTVTLTYPDGTQTVDIYANGRLLNEKTLGTDGVQISSTSYTYDALGRNDSVTDWMGTTSFDLEKDGSVKAVHFPDGRSQTVNSTDAKSGAPTQVTLPNGQTQNTGLNTRGQQTTQSGAAVLPARFTYDANTGALTGLNLFQSGTLDTGTAETTTWGYDAATGLLTSKTYNNSTSDTYEYNSKFQLQNLTRPFVHTHFDYDSAGRQTTATSTDETTGLSVVRSSGKFDDQGRPTSVTEATNDAGGEVHSSVTNAYTYNPDGQLATESQVGNVTMVYEYYPKTGYGSTGAPGALKDIKITQVVNNTSYILSQTDYAYQPSSKRLGTVTVKNFQSGVVVSSQDFIYHYKSGTNLVQSIEAGVLLTAYGYEPTTGRLASITSTSSVGEEIQTLYDANYTYFDNDQRKTESVTQLNSDDTTSSHAWTFGYDGRNQLTSVLNTADSSSLYTFGYDGAGNRNDAAFQTEYGSANGMNQYSGLTYNSRGDLIDNGAYHFTWNAKDELIAETPNNPTAGSQKLEFQYDAQMRRTQEEVYNWNATLGEWDAEPTKVIKFVYQGGQLAAELDGDNHLLVTLTRDLGGKLIAVTDYTGATPKTYAVVQDGTSSTVALEDPLNGSVSATFQYAPFGVRTSALGPVATVCPEQFGGMIYDGSAALPYFAWHRYYSAQQGRFISRDPIAEGGAMNTSVYADNDPVNQFDPEGLTPKQANAYITSLPREIQNRLGLIEMSLPDNWVMMQNSDLSLIPEDEPFRKYFIQYQARYFDYQLEAMWGYTKEGLYWHRMYPGGDEIVPCVICHGHDGTGRLPGLMLTDNCINGTWIRSGSTGDILQNYAAGMAGAGTRMGIQSYKQAFWFLNTPGISSAIDRFSDKVGGWVENNLKSTSSGVVNSNMVMSGRIGGYAMPLMLSLAPAIGAEAVEVEAVEFFSATSNFRTASTARWKFSGNSQQNSATTSATEYLAARFEARGGTWRVPNKTAQELGYNGWYDPETNSITLASDASRGTILEELVHFRQAEMLKNIGKPWPRNLIPSLENGPLGGTPPGARTLLREIYGFTRE